MSKYHQQGQNHTEDKKKSLKKNQDNQYPYKREQNNAPKQFNRIIRDENGLTEKEFLAAYRPGDYVRPSVAADMVIFTVTEESINNYRKLPQKQLSVLLIERGGHPFLGCFALPGGFVRPNETTLEAAKRELREETGLDHVYLEQLYTFSEPERDPRTWVMSCSHMALIDSSKVQPKAGDDARRAAWFQVTLQLLDEHIEYQQKKGASCSSVIRTQHYELNLTGEGTILRSLIEKVITKENGAVTTTYDIQENNGLAFDHAKIITYALERLRNKLEYTDLALNLMPEEFTLTQFQQVYEIILDKPFLKAAFRRKIAPLVEETDFFTEKEGHRPSRLYRRKQTF